MSVLGIIRNKNEEKINLVLDFKIYYYNKQ